MDVTEGNRYKTVSKPGCPNLGQPVLNFAICQRRYESSTDKSIANCRHSWTHVIESERVQV